MSYNSVVIRLSDQDNVSHSPLQAPPPRERAECESRRWVADLYKIAAITFLQLLSLSSVSLTSSELSLFSSNVGPGIRVSVVGVVSPISSASSDPWRSVFSVNSLFWVVFDLFCVVKFLFVLINALWLRILFVECSLNITRWEQETNSL